MKTNVLNTLIVLFLIINPALSQKRVIKERPILEYKTVFESDPLLGDSTSFWKYNSKYKEWNRQKGSQYHPEDEGQNFTFLKSLLITQGNKNYYVIVFDNVRVHKLSLYGMYKLNSSSEFAETNTCHFVILTQDDVEKIRRQFELRNGHSLKVVSNLCGVTILKDSYRDIHTNFDYVLNKRGSKNSMGFWIKFESIDGQDIVRFRLPEDFIRSRGYFKKNYYEISIDEFSKLIPPHNKFLINDK